MTRPKVSKDRKSKTQLYVREQFVADSHVMCSGERAGSLLPSIWHGCGGLSSVKCSVYECERESAMQIVILAQMLGGDSMVPFSVS